jgi:hypothetical protein
MVPQHHLPTTQKGDPTLPDNYRPILLMNSLLKLWTATIKDAGSKYAKTHGILSDQQDGFRQQRSIHDAMSSIITMMEDAKFTKKTSMSCTRTSRGLQERLQCRIPGARRRRSGGGPGGGCARMPVGIPSPPSARRLKPRSRAMRGTEGG